MFNLFKRKKPVDKSAVELIEDELALAIDKRLEAGCILDKAELMTGHDRLYKLHKLELLRLAGLKVGKLKVRLKNANIRHSEELLRIADKKRYERQRQHEIITNNEYRLIKRILKARLSEDEYLDIMNEVNAG